MKPVHSTLMGCALALAGCTTTNPPYDASPDVVSPDAALLCDPEECPSGRCINGRCAPSCEEGGACAPGETCCHGICTDLTDDPQNCGVCGTVCGPHQACTGAACSAVIL